jgi:hypothetical protein
VWPTIHALSPLLIHLSRHCGAQPMFESPFHFTVDVIAWAKHLNTHVPSDHWLHTIAYLVMLLVIVQSWRIIQAEIKKQEKKDT